MGTNTSKPCAYAENNSRTASCRQGVRYVNVVYGGNGVSRMGGVHTSAPHKRSKAQQTRSQTNTPSLSHDTAHLSYRHIDSDVGDMASRRVAVDTLVDEPLPPYSR